MPQNIQISMTEPFRANNTDYLSLDRIATVASTLLIFVMGRFQLADLFGVKRILEIILFLPILVYFLARLENFSAQKHFNPLIIIVFLMLFVNFYDHDFLWLFDYLFSFITLYVLITVSHDNIIVGAKWIVSIACFFSVLALLQFVILLFFPSLTNYTQLALLDSGDWTSISLTEGATVVKSFNPIAFFGLMTFETLNVFGIQISRMRSFTSEPSLLVVFFLFPAVIGLFLNEKKWVTSSIIIIVFSLLSISGSVLICFVFGAIYILASILFPTRFIFIYFPIIILATTLFVMITIGIDVFTSFDSGLRDSETTEFLAKGNSLVVRAGGLISAFNAAIHSPLGDPLYPSTLPVSIFLSVMIKAGWLGAILLLIFLNRLIKRVDNKLKTEIHNKLITKTAVAILFGIICTTCLFNDYAMLNYSGLILLFFVYRVLEPDTMKKQKQL